MATYEVQFDDGVYEVEFEDSQDYTPSKSKPKNPSGFEQLSTEEVEPLSSAGYSLYDLPENLWNMGKDLSGFLQHPVDTTINAGLEKSARVGGGLAAGAAGAGTGAMFGSALGPLGTLGGGAIGFGAGLMGFDTLNELTGADEPTTPEYKLNKLVYDTTQAAPFGLGELRGGLKGNRPPSSGGGGLEVPPNSGGIPTSIEAPILPPTKYELQAGQKIKDYTQNPNVSTSIIEALEAQKADPFLQYKSLGEVLDNTALKNAENTLTGTAGDPLFRGRLLEKNRARDAKTVELLDSIESPKLDAKGNKIQSDAAVQQIIERNLENQKLQKQKLLENMELETQATLAKLRGDVTKLTDPIRASVEASEVLGTQIVGQLEPIAKNKKTGVRDAYDAFPADKFKIDVEAPIQASAIRYYPEGSNVPDSVKKTVERFSKEGEPSLLFDPTTGKLATMEAPPTTLRELQAKIKEIGFMRKAAQGTEKAFYGEVIETLNNAIKDAGKRGDLPPATFEQFNNAQAKRIDYDLTYEGSPAGRILKERKYGKEAYPMSAVPAEFFVKGDYGFEAGANYKKTLGATPQALEPMHKYVMSKYAERAIGEDGLLNKKRAGDFVREHSPFLKQFPDLRKQLTDPIRAQAMLDEYVGRPKRTTKEIQSKVLEGLTGVDPNFLVPKILSGNRPLKNLREAKKAISNNPDGMAHLRTAFKDHIKNVSLKGMDLTSQAVMAEQTQLSTAAARNFIDKHQLVLKEVFTEPQYKVITDIYGDLGSRYSIEIANPAKGSPTASRMSGWEAIKSHVFQRVVRASLGTGIFPTTAQLLLDLRNNIGAAKMMDRLAEAIIQDPKLAARITANATPETTHVIVKQIFSPEQASQAGVIQGTKAGLVSPAPERRKEPRVVQDITSKKSFPTPDEVATPPNVAKKKEVSFETEQGDNVTEDEAIAKIKEDPYLHALALAESDFKPSATNEESSASGIFQFVNATAKSLGVKNPFSVAESYEGIQKMRAEDEARFGSDPFMLYSAHYLGATVLNKLLKGKPLSEKEQSQVDYLQNEALPRFKRKYAKVTSSSEMV